jgi:tetratricopeptide (TPR) repeat protein
MCFLRDQSLDNSFGTRDILMMALEKIRMQLLSLEETHDPNGDIVQINDDLEHLAVTLNILGVINQEMGSLDEAIESFDLCFLTRNIQPSRDYAALGHTADTLGLLYFGAGKHQKALSAFRDALSIKESGLGEQSIDVARTLNNMGNVYFASGNLVEAIEHYEQSLEIKKRVLGNIHEEVANTLNNIAHVLFKSDRFNESLDMYMEVFQIRHVLHGNDNLGLALTYSNIGDVHLKMGHMEDASVCLERCLQIKESHNANRNEEGVRIMESLALIYGKLGKWKRAEDLYSTVVNIRTKSLGQDKTEALCNSLKCLAMSLMEQRLFHECLPHLYEALRIRTLYVLTSSSDEISELMQLINFCKSRQ